MSVFANENDPNDNRIICIQTKMSTEQTAIDTNKIINENNYLKKAK